MSKNTETYEKVTAAILALIETGDLLPWQKPWKGESEFARSMSSGKLYNGINRWILTLTAQARGWSPWFGTYNQIAALGGQVRKSEKASIAILWKPMEREGADGSTEKWLMLRTFNVFSASQADGLPEKFYAKPDPVELDTDVDGVFVRYTERESIEVTFGGDRAFYAPAQDRINLPHAGSFDSTDHYFATAFHEAVHSTGHKTRLNRDELNDAKVFGDHAYSREELVAEFGSALVLAALGVDKPNVVENQAAYLKGWLSKIASDPQAIVWAAGKAEKAANRILGEDEKEEVEA